MSNCGPQIDRASAISSMVDRGGIFCTVYNSTACSGDTTYISNELHQFNYSLYTNNTITLDGRVSLIGATTNWTLSNADIISGSIVVTDTSGASSYIENKDYTVQYEIGTVTRILTGSLKNLDIISVNYSFHLDCIDEKTGNPNRFCKTCKDIDRGNLSTGIIYYQSFTRKALFHIPNYDSPFDKNGIWKQGDAVLTFPYGININATGNSGQIFLQDKVKILNQPGIWMVMSQPQSIQMGSYLGIRCHLRKIEL
jgi:hypothetical protein